VSFTGVRGRVFLGSSPVWVVPPLYVWGLKSYLSRWRDKPQLNQRAQPV
jgi:hypothetical protein